MVKVSHSLSELSCSALDPAWVHTLAAPMHTDESKSSDGVGCAAFFSDFDVFIYLPLVALIFTAELCAILALSRISFHDSNNFDIYSDSRNALQALGSLYMFNTLVLQICSLCNLHAHRKFAISCWIPSHIGLSGNEKSNVLASYLWAIIMPYSFRTTFPQFAIPSVLPSIPIGTSVLRVTISWFS